MTSTFNDDHVRVLNLGYIGVRAPDIDAWVDFGQNILGATMSKSDDGSTACMKVDDRVWRVMLSKGDAGAVDFLGFEVQGPQDLHHAELVLKQHNVDFEHLSGEQAAVRRVHELLRFQDPAGTTLELYYGQHRDYTFTSPKGVTFVTGDQGIGHCVRGVPNLDESVEFYQSVLGFKISDIAVQGRAKTVFMRCGPREHTVAMFQINPAKPAWLHHFMLELAELDDVGRAYDRIFDNNVPLAMTLGRHTNDSMVSFYCVTPAGFQVEYGWQGRRVQPTDAATTMVVGDVWGHRFVESGKDPNAGKSVNAILKKD